MIFFITAKQVSTTSNDVYNFHIMYPTDFDKHLLMTKFKQMYILIYIDAGILLKDETHKTRQVPS